MKFYSENVLHATGIKPEHISEHAGFEAADPAVFCPRGYAVINADIPGLWFGEGKATFVSPLEAEAFADLIEVNTPYYRHELTDSGRAHNLGVMATLDFRE